MERFKINTKIDLKYPRKCFKCNCKLFFREFLHSNGIYRSQHCSNEDVWEGMYERYKYIKELWKSNLYEFFCCSCFDEIKITQYLKKL